MKKFIVIAALLLGSAPMYATEQRTNEGSTLLAQYNNEQIVRAYYPSNGQLASIKIKIRGSFVVAFSTGKDFVGAENWHMLQSPAGITRTNSSLDGQLAREFNNKATLPISDGYHVSSLTVYF